MTIISFTQFFLYYWSSFLNGEIESHDLKDYSTSPHPETEVLLLVIWRDGLHCFNHIPNKLFESFGVKKNPKTIYDEQKKANDVFWLDSILHCVFLVYKFLS